MQKITEGEVITTPFSYVATTSAILWERCTPVFVDIEPETLCIDPNKIEAAITPATKAIMPVHVFGFPCDVEKIDAIAKKHNLKVIYDAAHAFGVTYNGKSLFSYGDISTSSFHATKLFHTIEGGGIFTANKNISDKLELMKRFGQEGDDQLILGINAKSSEFQAAMGLANLLYVDENIAKRKALYELYSHRLGGGYMPVHLREGGEHNYGYFPVVLETEELMHQVVGKLNDQNIFPRRYFHPSLNQLPYIATKQSCPISEDIASRILCLPLYVGLEETTVKKICEVMNT